MFSFFFQKNYCTFDAEKLQKKSFKNAKISGKIWRLIQGGFQKKVL